MQTLHSDIYKEGRNCNHSRVRLATLRWGKREGEEKAGGERKGGVWRRARTVLRSQRLSQWA